jgi:hypothetical protein
MRQLHVRKVSDEVVARLKQQAARAGRSMEAEHRLILEEALFPSVVPGESCSRSFRQVLSPSPIFSLSGPATTAVALSCERLPPGHLVPVRARQRGSSDLRCSASLVSDAG